METQLHVKSIRLEVNAETSGYFNPRMFRVPLKKALDFQ